MSIVAVDTITDASGGNTASLNGIVLNTGLLEPENRIINGAFDFWQRGTSFSTDQYGADRWINSYLTGTVTQSRQAFTTGDTLGSNSPAYFLRQTVSDQQPSGGWLPYAIIKQRIEDVRSYAGQTITVLGWAKRSSGTGNMSVEVEQSFGTGGTFSTNAWASAPAVTTLSATWQPFAAVIDVPSLETKTLGTDNNNYLSINFWISAWDTFDSRTNNLGVQTIGVDLWGIHIRLGVHTADATTLYRHPELGPEFARCRRYYTKLGGEVINDILIQGPMSTGTAFAATFALPVVMRARPTATKVGTWGTFNCQQPSIVAPTTTTLSINTAGSYGTIVGAGVGTLNTTTYITLDAEL